MKTKISRLIRNLTVGRKLALIYFLDLTAVIFVSAILINEKYIAINFARKEVLGNHYIEVIRDSLLNLVVHHAAGSEGSGKKRGPSSASAILQAEENFGGEMQSAALSKDFAASLQTIESMQDQQRFPESLEGATAFYKGRELLTRIGNQSNLILDPDLDSYYTMSLIVLRFPELLEILPNITVLAQKLPSLKGVEHQISQTQFLIYEGRLDAIINGIKSDYAEAIAASTPQLHTSLAPSRDALIAAIERFRNASKVLAGVDNASLPVTDYVQIHNQAIAALSAAWKTTTAEMDRLLDVRIDGFFQRMWSHLGIAVLLLLVILSIVYFVANQIALPIRRLEMLTKKVRLSGDYSLRADWDSNDEIGRLVTGFNGMLKQLDLQRVMQQELVAQTRAAQAQRELIEAIPIPLIVTAVPNHEVLHANEAGQAWLSDSLKEPWGTSLDQATRARFFQSLQDVGAVDEREICWHGNTPASWALVSARCLDYQGRPAVMTTFTPINKMKHMEQRLELWAKVFEASSEGIAIINADGRIANVNHAFCKHTGYDLNALVRRMPGFLLAAQNERNLISTILKAVAAKNVWQGEIWITRKNGDVYPAWMVFNAVRNPSGEITHYIAVTFDISERKASEQRIQYLAHHDPLTGLPNRLLCMERLQLSLQQAARTGMHVAVLFMDLDRFKNINDSLGHHIGDALLCSVAGRLSEVVRDGDTVCRLGGDEFVVILNGISNIDEIGKIVKYRMIPLIQQVHNVNGSELFISCSVGVAVFPEDGTDIDTLMRHSDAAMYQAKEQGRNNAQFFTAALNDRVVSRLQIENDLRHAVERQELVLHYQPRIMAHTGELSGAECLVRWNRHGEGLVTPDNFIPIAEESGLIVPIGDWIIREAFRQHDEWRASGVGMVPISINLSAVQIKHGELVASLKSALAAYPVDPAHIELELTESILMENVNDTITVLQELKQLGFMLSIDDFGIGYSSLNYLFRFPIDKLKIDRTFIQNMHAEPHHLAVTNAIIGLGHTLGLEVVAEGVEHERDVAMLRHAGCDELQGYYFSRPMPADHFSTWLLAHRMRIPNRTEASVNCM